MKIVIEIPELKELRERVEKLEKNRFSLNPVTLAGPMCLDTAYDPAPDSLDCDMIAEQKK
jgi:hypothetical protein